jgi:diguanylate cyclase (GGDEF)-like protein/PAS domain S-box-containing protein
MIKIYTCISAHHDWRLVLIAVAVCLLSCATAMGMLDRTGKAWGLSRAAWLSVTAAVTGVGVWATHFIAMLGFKSNLPTSYDPVQTAASLLVAIIVLGVAFHVALQPRLRHAPALGGAIAGVAIAAMHYLGMAGFWIGGHKTWAPGMVGASLVLGVGFGALSFILALGPRRLARQSGGALLLTTAICGLHFAGMSAVSVRPDPTMVFPRGVVTNNDFAHWVAAAAIALLLVSIAALLVGQHQRRIEKRRLQELADATVEGLAICDEGLIVTANASLARMVGSTADQLVGRPFLSLLSEDGIPCDGGLSAGLHLETRIHSTHGKPIPVELLAHALSSDGKPRLAVAVRDLRDRLAAEARMRFLALHDSLTGLPNRASFDERLGQEFELHRRRDDEFAVLYLDLDRFKQVNDLLGHAAGDILLKTVSQRIARELREAEVLIRLGGDEFAIICPHVEQLADIARLCERILAAVTPEVLIEGQAAAVGVSIGIALYPGDGDTPALLQRNADAALYQAKSEGRGGYRFFEKSLGAKLREREAMEFDLRRALVRGELSVVYQPQVSTRDGAIFGFEALVRWTSPVRGAVSPGLFIPLAEETGLIAPIGEWVLRQACAEAARWSKPLQIAVNVSGAQLRVASLAQRFHQILLETGLAPERLEIEITETALIEDFDRALDSLRQLKALGVKVAMDDFGTGYSSLSNLRAFPFDKIKIDQSFVRGVQANEHGAAIVRAIVGLCQGLGLSVLAEGVETVEELKFLDEQCCPQAQGYLFGRPGEIGDFIHAFVETAPRHKLREPA